MNALSIFSGRKGILYMNVLESFHKNDCKCEKLVVSYVHTIYENSIESQKMGESEEYRDASNNL